MHPSWAHFYWLALLAQSEFQRASSVRTLCPEYPHLRPELLPQRCHVKNLHGLFSAPQFGACEVPSVEKMESRGPIRRLLSLMLPSPLNSHLSVMCSLSKLTTGKHSGNEKKSLIRVLPSWFLMIESTIRVIA